MKKMLTAVFALLLCFSLTSAVKAADKADVLGEWYADMFGISMTLTLNEDDTYNMVMTITPDEAETGNWELKDDKIILDGEEDSALTIDGETLKVESDGMEIIFTREPVEAFTPAEPKTDAAVEEFAGKWEADHVTFFGMTMDCVAANLDLRVTVDGTKVILDSTAMEIDNQEVECEFEDGMLVMDVTDEMNALSAETAAEGEEVESTEAGSTGYSLQLLQDGSMSISLNFFGEAVTFYTNSVEEFTIPEPVEESGEAVETTEEAA